MINRAMICTAGLLLLFTWGCTPEPKSNPRDKALQDPMNYNPAGSEREDISGGGLLDFDKKAFRKDVDDVLNP